MLPPGAFLFIYIQAMSKLPFSERVLQYAPWSISKADVARQCGLKFHYKYIEKVREPESGRSEGRVGSAAHKALELVLKGTDLNRAFRVAAVDGKLTTKEMDDLATFNGSIVEFVDRIGKFKTKNEAEHEYIEHQFGLTIELKPTGFFSPDVFFRGAWDMGIVLKNKDLVILDHKSGEPSQDIKKYDNQLKVYALSAKAERPDLRGVQSGVHFLKDGSIVFGTFVKAETITNEFIDWFVNHLNESVASLERKPTKGWWCGFCGYQNSCPAFNKK